MSHATVLFLAVAGFACLALSMERHQRDELGSRLPHGTSRRLRGCGFLLIAAALPVAIRGLGTGFGLVAWTGHLSLAAAVVMITLLTRQRRRDAARARR